MYELDKLKEHITGLAERYMKAYLSGPYSLGYVSIIFGQNSSTIHAIEFQAFPSSSGMNPITRFSADYLDDCSTLEQDAMERRDKEAKERSDKMERIRELERDPLIREYVDVKGLYVQNFRCY